MPAITRVLAMAACVIVCSAPVLAQQRGVITGRVLDPDGLALPGASIVITNQDTGFTREAVSAGTGAYSVPNLDREPIASRSRWPASVR
ncbi:MAG: carboxypeptidase regulatory-like domain-containing protein [Acidobacteria bacterium]|nr:carboxypeptidase regulatory-like domain-containing protein [Acidobacteriota bacterium]